MLDGIFESANYVAANRMLDASVQRHNALAQNIANLETPGYTRRDIQPEFQSELNRMLASRDIAGMRELQPTIMIDAASANGPGGTVNLESELLEVNRNALQYETLTQFVSGSLRHLRMAITGRSL